MVARTGFETLSTWRERVFAELARYLGPLGFKLRETWQVFDRRLSKEVRQGFHLNVALYPRVPQLDLICSAHVRHETVERLVMDWRTDVSATSKRQTATIGQELGVLDTGQTRIFKITHESKLESNCEEMYELITRIGLPYVEMFSDLRLVYEALKDDRSRWHRGLISLRCHHVPVIKLMLEGPESVTSLFREEYNRLKQLDDPNAHSYPDFVRHIESKFGISVNL